MNEADAHMTDMLIASYLDRRLSDAERERFENHLAECPECRQAVIEAESLLKRVRPTWKVNKVVALIAAVLVLVAVDLKIQHSNDLSAPTTARAISTADAGLTAYGPSGEVTRSGLRFVWSPLAGAISYKILLVDARSRPVWSAAAADTSISLPATVVLRSGENYLWAVDALASDGTTHSTGLREFRVNR
jgi:predicted anti-sigma-YlaC factor YlaD